MTQDPREVLQILRYELNYLEQGGFDRSREMLGPESPFQGSYACINFNDPLQAHACRECRLFQFVPDSKKTEELPCHHILLGDSGETIDRLIEKNDPGHLKMVLEQWLRTTIATLEENSNQDEES